MDVELRETEIDGEKVVIVNKDLFQASFKPKRISKKQRLLMENGIDIKYLSRIHSSKGKHSFKIENISSVEDLKMIISIQEKLEIFPSVKQFYQVLFESLKAQDLPEPFKEILKTVNAIEALNGTKEKILNMEQENFDKLKAFVKDIRDPLEYEPETLIETLGTLGNLLGNETNLDEILSSNNLLKK